MQNKGFICQFPYQTQTRPHLCNLSIYHLRHFFPSDNGLLFKSIVKKGVGEELLTTTNNHVGHQQWELDHDKNGVFDHLSECWC
ncbi:hypothetical protein HanXRQr2_Chr06g0261471 [Helianthus annuus]|uniref:Uncharacterized protein n=1 Tax=Helianthus annuus TaxID=4232 RepID=A0A251TXR2_HELAN|nr:hypothetical protein HanXRQr2_Chr06g0261471 [Helianthus annuus]